MLLLRESKQTSLERSDAGLGHCDSERWKEVEEEMSRVLYSAGKGVLESKIRQSRDEQVWEAAR